MSLIPSPLTEPLLSGAAPIAGAAVHPHRASNVNTTSREMLAGASEVGEMSLAALPIFTGRRFLHGAVTLVPGVHLNRLTELRRRRMNFSQLRGPMIPAEQAPQGRTILIPHAHPTPRVGG